MIIIRKTFSRIGKEEKKKYEAINKAELAGFGSGLGATSLLLAKANYDYNKAKKSETLKKESLDKKAKDKLDEIVNRINKTGKEVYNKVRNQDNILDDYYRMKEINSAKGLYTREALNRYSNEVENINSKFKSSLNNLNKKYNKEIVKGRLIGPGVGLITGLGTYYLVNNRNKKQKNKKKE